MKIKFVNLIKKGFSDGEFVRPILCLSFLMTILLVLAYSFIEYDFSWRDFRIVMVCIYAIIIASIRIE